jgi:integrase
LSGIFDALNREIPERLQPGDETYVSEPLWRVVWHVVKGRGAKLGLPPLAPHDLRRSCARLYHIAGSDLEQIQRLFGHITGTKVLLRLRTLTLMSSIR